MKINVKLIAGFLAIALLVLFVGYFGIRSTSTIQKNNKVVIGLLELENLLDDSLIRILELIETKSLEDYYLHKSYTEDLRKEFDMVYEKNYEIILDFTKTFDKDIDEFTKLSNGIIAIQKESIILQKEFDEKYKLERQLRYFIRDPLLALEDLELTKEFGDLQYRSKGLLFQYRNKKELDEWLNTLKNIKNNPLVKQLPEVMDNLNKYEIVAQDLGEIVVEQKRSEDEQYIKFEQLEGITDRLGEQEERIISAMHSETQSIENRVYSTLLAVIIAAFAASIALGLYIAHSISKPIQELAKASEEIKKGNLNYEIKVKSKDEIGELAETFDEMRLGLNLDVKDRNELLNSLLNVFKGKFGRVATILMRKNIQELVDKNPRIKKILPKSFGTIVARESKGQTTVSPEKLAKLGLIKTKK